MAKNRCSVLFSLILSFLTMGRCFLFAQEAPADASRAQTQVISIGILQFRDESDSNVAQFGERITQQLRQKILLSSQDLLPKILGADAGAAAQPGMTVQELTDLGRQFGVKLVVRGGILPVTLDTANGQTIATVRLYADILSIDSGAINTVRVEGSDTQPGSFADLAGSDATSPDFAKGPVGQALERALDRLSEVIREQAVSLTAVAPVQETPPTETPQPESAEESAPDAVDPTAEAADQDLELQQLIADAQAALNAGAAADPQLLNQVSQGLANLQSNLAVKADLLQKGEDTEQVEQNIFQCRTDLRAAIDAVMQSQAVATSAGFPAADGSPQAGNILSEANNYASEATNLIQKIKDLRAMLWGANQEAQVVSQDQYGAVAEQSAEQPTEQPIEEVTGVVIDDGQPVAGAEVTDSDSGTTTTTGPDGRFILPIQPGILSSITVKRRGQLLATNRIQVVKGRANVADFVLSKSGSSASAGAISSTSVGRAVKGSGGIIKGSITNPEGKPAAQVLVQLPGVGTVRSNTLGQFAFVNVPAGLQKLSIQQPGIEPQMIQVRVTSKATANATVRLAAARLVRPIATTPLIAAGSGALIYGRVKDNQDKNVIGAQVTAIRDRSTVVVMTGREGKYELKDLTPGTYQIRLSKPGYQGTQANVTLRSNKKEKRDFEMQVVSSMLGQLRKIEEAKLGGLKGKIKASDNRAVAGATVEAVPIGQQLSSAKTQTTSNGEFKLSLRQGRYQIKVTQATFRSETRSVTIQAGKSTQQDFTLAKALGVTPGLVKTIPGTSTVTAPASNEARKTPTVGSVQTLRTAPAPGRITGRTTDSQTGKPLSSAQVFVQGRLSVQTDRSGNYMVENLPPGKHQIGIKANGYVSQERGIDVRAGGSTRADFALAPVAAAVSRSTAAKVGPAVALSLSPGQIGGRVIDSKTGKPISGVSVALSGLGSTATDASGTYRLGNLKPNTYQISVSRNGYQRQQRTVKVDSGRTITADFALAPIVITPRVIPRK